MPGMTQLMRNKYTGTAVFSSADFANDHPTT